MLKMLMLLLTVVVVVVCTVRNGRFVGNRSRVGRDGGVALLLRWGSVVACRRIHGWVGLCWTSGERQVPLIHNH